MNFETGIKYTATKNGWEYEDVTEVHCDFESSLIAATLFVFNFLLHGTGKNLIIFGCYFHFM